MKVEVQDLGIFPYKRALGLQMDLRRRRIANEIPDQLVILEHPPVFTMGKRRCEDDFLMSHEKIKSQGIEIVETDRGGRVTYHGPGQLVAYFIFKLNNIGVKDFVTKLEDVCMQSIKAAGIETNKDSEHPGVWVGKNKIAAVGLHIDNNVTMHGVAINVSCDLEPYKYIVACGITDGGLTTISQEIDKPVSMDEFKVKFLDAVQKEFNCQLSQLNL